MQNAPDLGGYSRSIAAGKFADREGPRAVATTTALRAAIIERLMCDLEVDLDAVAGRAQQFAPEIEALKPLADEGLLQIDGTPHRGDRAAAAPYVRIAAAAFDAYLAVSAEAAFGGGVAASDGFTARTSTFAGALNGALRATRSDCDRWARALANRCALRTALAALAGIDRHAPASDTPVGQAAGAAAKIAAASSAPSRSVAAR